MASIPLYHLMDALSKLPPEFADQTNNYAEVPNILPIISDFLADYFQVEGVLDVIENKLSGLNPEGRRIFLIIIGVLVNGGTIPVLTQSQGLKLVEFAKQVILGTLVNISESLGKLVSPSQLSEDQDRAEELCRKVVEALDLTIDGETAEESKTRLYQLDSIELDKIQQEVQRKIQKALEEARQREAAAKTMRE